MIIVASQRGGGKQLGQHLLNARDNEHVEVHDIRGFASRDVVGAFKEAYAVSKGTRCKQFLFSVSFNPPETEHADIAAFEDAIGRVEERNGLSGQPRVIVFHEKEGRRHAHAVWSRIDAETMTARQMSHFKAKCTDISRELYLDHGWKMPKGLMSAKEKDPRNFTLEEWQQAKRVGYHAWVLKQTVQECWAVSDSRAGFASALEERGMKLARGDRRGHVIVTHEGEVLSVARYAGQNTKDVRARLGDEQALPSVERTKETFTQELTAQAKRHLDEQEQKQAAEMAPLLQRRDVMRDAHSAEREKLKAGQAERWEAECRDRAARLNSGLRGLWDRLNGSHAQTKRQNEREAYEALQRDRKQKQDLINAQLADRQRLQALIRQQRAEATRERLEIHKRLDDLRKGRLEQKKPKPKHRPTPAQTKSSKPSFDRANQAQSSPQDRLAKLRQQDLGTTSDRLQQLRQRQQKPAPKRDGPDMER
ncbi:relaxase [Parvularcula flava]|uniref:Relaxase n=1 Tax=Aquisalinus luteolus TaxID=1566827 RepID=A0A8J3EQ49_9PROT|nr:relaxase [Aquisalinus luteolus]NHK28911.1 relaxase [Aquisalinus luteolus]GGI00884.1 hypothetical protein GCM10011355_30230 [Aquisalinus luteolus]